ncbi:response regulator transcription factor [Insolitispirillum peregrinum]|uniref:response regulator transcription factor n=1 Tax=Insolitispirillum peregrinum TaxID=80876 RepID=UPI0036197280
MRILLVDDDVQLTSLLAEYLTAEGFEVEAVHTGDAGVTAALSGRFAAVILDIMLPRIGGIDVLRHIRHSSSLPVIMLTAKGDDIDRVIGLEMGADDYMPKPCYPRELVARLRAVLRRTHEPAAPAPVAPPDELVNGPLRLASGSRRVWCGSVQLDLTASEFNVLEVLLQAIDTVVSKDELSLRVLGRPREPYDRSIDVHISNLRQKLAASLGAEQVPIETVRGVGYLMKALP